MDPELFECLEDWYDAYARTRRLGRKQLEMNMKNGHQPGLSALGRRVEQARDELQEAQMRLVRKYEFVVGVEDPLPQYLFEKVKL